MTETNTPSGAKPRRLQRIVLALSLALNFLVIGIFAGAVLTGKGLNGQQRFDLTVGPLTRAMDGDDRDAVRDALRDSGAFQRQDRTAMRADMGALLDTLRADEFDDAAFRAALTRQRTRLQSGQDAVLDAVSDQIAGMSQRERTAFADRLQDQARRGPPRRQ